MNTSRTIIETALAEKPAGLSSREVVTLLGHSVSPGNEAQVTKRLIQDHGLPIILIGKGRASRWIHRGEAE